MELHLKRRIDRLRTIRSEQGLWAAIAYPFRYGANQARYMAVFFFRFFLSDPRGILILLAKLRFTTKTPASLRKFGNYVLCDEKLDSDSIVYSFGIGRNITFDRAIAERFDCRVCAYDPTPLAIIYMANHNDDPRIVFKPLGLWTENGRVAFHAIRNQSGLPVSGSITNIHDLSSNTVIEVEVRSLDSIMQKNHHDHIDLLKMDIEGAAVPVLEQALLNGLRPRQIVAELEFPKRALSAFYRDVWRLLRTMEAAGYQLLSLPARRANVNFSIELIAKLERQTPHG